MPPPTLGLNAVDAIAMQDARDALQMDNVISTSKGLEVRNGWKEFAVSINAGAPVQSILVYQNASTNSLIDPAIASKVFAVTDNGIWDVTAGGVISGGPAIALSGTSGAGRVEMTQFKIDTNNWLIACSETDGGYVYSAGTGWIKMTTTGGPGPGIVTGTGVDPTKFAFPLVWKSRLMFAERGSSRVWYLGVNQVGGAMSVFDFGPIMRSGGAVTNIASWTLDAGAGMDDRLVIVGSMGDVAVYQGLDISDPANFSIIGTWNVGRVPLGRRAVSTIGGNIYLFCSSGLVPLSQLVTGGLDSILSSNTENLVQLRKIGPLLSSDYDDTRTQLGWELHFCMSESLMILMRPPKSSTNFVQYVFYQLTNAWSSLSNVPALCLQTVNGLTYFGTPDGRVCQLFVGGMDNVPYNGSVGNAVTWTVQTSFNYFGSRGQNKLMKLVRPTILAADKPNIDVTILADYAQNAGASTPNYTVPTTALWTQAVWNVSQWGGGLSSYTTWLGVNSPFGYCYSTIVRGASTSRTVLAAFDYLIETGGIL